MYQWIKVFSLVLFCSFSSLVFADNVFIEKPDVQAFIQQMHDKYQFDKKQLLALFKTVKLQPGVIDNIQHPLEKETWKIYQKVFLDEGHINEGASFRKQYHTALVNAEKKYGVPGSIILATLGVETQFGKRLGSYRVVDSLSNLAFNNQHRANFFRTELEQFLLLAREQCLDPYSVQGSYAGAIGAPQFMPSSYRYYAVSSSNQTQVDLVHSMNDAIASVANYYKVHGWQGPDLVAIPVTLTGQDYLKLIKSDGSPTTFSSSQAARYGISSQKKIPKGYPVKLIDLQGAQGTEYWLVFHDFDVIKQYNASNLYAMAVFQLSRNIFNLSEKGKSNLMDWGPLKISIFILILSSFIWLAGCGTSHRKDGPPHFRVDVSRIPDAVPKAEPLSRIGNKPYYTVFGRRYHVMRSRKNYAAIGIASWYGTQFDKRRTSNGEIYNMLGMTAAHRTLPLPTYVKVTNLENGRHVIVRVNDRGPFEKNRIIDLSYAAAKKIGMNHKGTALVEIRALNPQSRHQRYATRQTHRHHRPRG